jgi:photosystem II stability/assembly factor-like uncharacterized protein
MGRFLQLALILVLVHTGIYAQSTTDTGVNSLNNVFKPMKWRSIGPFRGGRSVAACGVVDNPAVYYMGTTGGGLWKTDDMGITWRNISDGYFKSSSVGAVAVAESDANIVYVGMGEHAVRGVMTHSGDGVYKSTDAGKSWHKIGLETTQHIARIAIHPKDPNIVYIAAQGALYGKSADRGIYKSVDGGANWKKILYVDENTGCNELSMDMNNPAIVYASMWDHGRKPWQVKSGGPGSGLYKSTDGGAHWEKLQTGLPKEMGKMAIAVCRSNSEKVFALIESDYTKEAGGLYVSTDAGKSWSQVTNDHRLIQRSWYYIKLFTDPLNENTLYVMSAPAMRSIDGGKTWEDISATHGDYHNLWINPKNANNMIIADDGGAAISFNQGKSWSSQHNMPTAQFYRINVDNQFPYRIYGGQQDNTSVSIASRELNSGGISTNSWSASAGGESAFLAFDPNDPRYVLGGSYQGTIDVLDTKAKASTNIMAAPIQYLGRDAKDMKYRFNWNAPIIWSQHEANTFYHGAQVLLKTSDYGKNWKEVSPDLTRNEKDKQGKAGVPFSNEAVGAENYGTLSYLMESPHEKGVIYTGSDDGLVYLTKDGGNNWQNVTPAGLSECLINAIEVSPHDKATAYIATTQYKFNNHTPALYKTTDYGKTWINISAGIPHGAFTRVVREDAVLKDLLFAGTETGLFLSWNGGKNWAPFQLNLPLTPITDLRIHQGNLIAATSGRSFWILDDLSLLRQYKKAANLLTLYQPADTYIVTGGSELDANNPNISGTNDFRGVNPATGVVLYYQLPAIKDQEVVQLEIKDAEGNFVASFSSKADASFKKYDGGPNETPTLSANKGLNRFVWNMHYPTLPGVPNVYIESSYRGHKAIPGKYSYTLKVGDQQSITSAAILPNPFYGISAEDYKKFHVFISEVEKNVTAMHNLVNTLYAKRLQLETIIAGLPNQENLKSVNNEAALLVKKMKDWDEEMIQRKSTAYDDVENFPNKFTADYMFAMNHIQSEIPILSTPSVERITELNATWEGLKKRGEDLLNNQIPTINQLFWKAGIGAVWNK